MIFDTLSNLKKYAPLHPDIEKQSLFYKRHNACSSQMGAMRFLSKVTSYCKVMRPNRFPR